MGDLGSIPGLGRSLEEGTGTHSSILARRISVHRGAWRAAVHGVAPSQTRLTDTAQHPARESCEVLGYWRLLQKAQWESLVVKSRHCGASLAAQMERICLQCRRSRFSPGWEDPLEKEMETQEYSVFLPGKPHGQRSLMGYSPWGGEESFTREPLMHTQWFREC